MNDDDFNPDWKDNNVQVLLKALEEKGWTLEAIADDLGNDNSELVRWKNGERYPQNSRSVCFHLENLLQQQRTPEK